VSAHAVDPDMRRYAVAEEGSRHYIDIDHYGAYPTTLCQEDGMRQQQNIPKTHL
jgi:hypothetical protein